MLLLKGLSYGKGDVFLNVLFPRAFFSACIHDSTVSALPSHSHTRPPRFPVPPPLRLSIDQCLDIRTILFYCILFLTFQRNHILASHPRLAI